MNISIQDMFAPGMPALINIIILLAFMPVVGCSSRPAGDPRITAHRGASHETPENTMIAYVKALEAGAGAAELDVHQTADGELVLMHDDTVDRTTNGTGSVWELTLKELRSLDAGSWFDDSFRGEPVPTLREIVRFAKGRIVLNIEVKVSREEPGIAEKVIGIVRDERIERDCFITSFDRHTVEEIKRLAPYLRVGFIFGRDYPEDVFDGVWEILSCNVGIVDSVFVARAHQAGKEVHVWTVNDEVTMRRLLALGVDSIITNRPALLAQVLEEEFEDLDDGSGGL